ncbi:metallophosphoesterase family protein [Bacillus carboniphilus]|uniref:Metallophosphoesterase family protein n=1 Tax=Bacillus carboniphilus TaxID=86663 RepID=A0ABY9JWI8_9BACI|nr:metallophosphoesterase [Bacillus carboniphilus]WLR43761.1 metallophosphoesterase family protein [Bacillus carboniphilus]
MTVSIIIIGVAFIVFINIMMVKNAFDNHLIKQVLTFSNFPSDNEQVNIFFISDIHRRLISKKLLDQIDQPIDVVIIGGDLAEKGVSLKRVKKNLVELKKIAPVYFVYGNNDEEIGARNLDALLLELGIIVLNNCAITLQLKNGTLNLAGIDDISKQRDRLDKALEGICGFTILVSHHPNVISQLGKKSEVDLVLSGHTHGGQIRLGPIGFYKKGSLDYYGHTAVLVSNGYGTTGIPMRIGAKSETHQLTIMKAN